MNIPYHPRQAHSASQWGPNDLATRGKSPAELQSVGWMELSHTCGALPQQKLVPIYLPISGRENSWVGCAQSPRAEDRIRACGLVSSIIHSTTKALTQYSPDRLAHEGESCVKKDSTPLPVLMYHKFYEAEIVVYHKSDDAELLMYHDSNTAKCSSIPRMVLTDSTYKR